MKFLFWTKFLLDLVRSKATKLLSKMLSHYMFCRVTQWRLAGRVEFAGFSYDFIFWESVNILQFGWYWERVSGSWEVLSILPFSQPFLLGWTSVLIFLETKNKSRNSMVTIIEKWFHFNLLIFAHSVREVKSCWGDFFSCTKGICNSCNPSFIKLCYMRLVLMVLC